MQFTNFPEIENLHKLRKRYQCGIESFDFVARENTLTDQENIDKLKKEYESIDSIHGPYKGLDYSSKDPQVIKKTYEDYHRFYAIAKDLGCKKVIVHNMCDPDEDPLGFNRSVDFWKDFLKDHLGVEFCLENIIDRSPDFLVKLHDAIDSDDLGICLDIGHVNVEVGDQVVHWIRSYGSRLAHAHLHNNYGEGDDHNGLGHGTIDILKALMTLKDYLSMKDWNLETSDVEASMIWLEANGLLSE